MTAGPFEKRVKRRVKAREHLFFAVCPPGLTRFCRDEIIKKGLPEDHVEQQKGGVQFKGKIADCMRMNLVLGSPSRILMRLSRFKAVHFAQLEKKTAEIDWELFLPSGCIPNIHVTLKKSALYHSDAVAQRCRAIITEKLTRQEDPAENDLRDQNVFIRADHDQFTFSIDSSGDGLFKRGMKKRVTAAPIRENLAYAMLHWSGFSGREILVDPMCGSGTFSMEGAMLQNGLPPGFFRNFAFESWPAVNINSLEWLRKKTADTGPGQAAAVYASDIDEDALEALAQNIEPLPFKDNIHIRNKDFFSLDPFKDFQNEKGLVILNPPYGKRLKNPDSNLSFFREIGKKLSADFRGFKFGMVLPSRRHLSATGLRAAATPIFHGGLDVLFGSGVL